MECINPTETIRIEDSITFQFLNMSLFFMYRSHARERAANLLKTKEKSKRITCEAENESGTNHLNPLKRLNFLSSLLQYNTESTCHIQEMEYENCL